MAQRIVLGRGVLVAVLVAGFWARAEESVKPGLEFGLLGGFSATNHAASGVAGVYLGQQLRTGSFTVGLSEDLQTPLPLFAESTLYVPLNLGLRLGWIVGESERYGDALRLQLGGLGSVLWLLDGPREQPLESRVGMAGVSLSVELILRKTVILGVEGRVQAGLTAVGPASSPTPALGQLLLSVRIAIWP